MPDLKVFVDRRRCIGAAVCTGIAPGVFRLDEHHRATVTRSDGADPDAIREAADACPARAIRVTSHPEGPAAAPGEAAGPSL